jgi:hypothetical protein
VLYCTVIRKDRLGQKPQTREIFVEHVTEM